MILEKISHNDSSYFSLTTTQANIDVNFQRPPTALNTQVRMVFKFSRAVRRFGLLLDQTCYGGE